MSNIKELIEKAFHYRGDVTITFAHGKKVEGYLYNREAKGTQGTPLAFFDMLLPNVVDPQRYFYRDVVNVELTGVDTASGKSWEAWVAKHEWKEGGSCESPVALPQYTGSQPAKLELLTTVGKND